MLRRVAWLALSHRQAQKVEAAALTRRTLASETSSFGKKALVAPTKSQTAGKLALEKHVLDLFFGADTRLQAALPCPK